MVLPNLCLIILSYSHLPSPRENTAFTKTPPHRRERLKAWAWLMPAAPIPCQAVEQNRHSSSHRLLTRIHSVDTFFLLPVQMQDEGFDFDAHVARLMEASAKETGLRQRTKDDDLQTKGLVRLRRDSDSESDDSEDDVATLDGGGAGSDDSGEIDDALLEGLDISGVGAGVCVPGEGTEEDRAVLDSQFEAVSAPLSGTPCKTLSSLSARHVLALEPVIRTP